MSQFIKFAENRGLDLGSVESWEYVPAADGKTSGLFIVMKSGNKINIYRNADKINDILESIALKLVE